MATTEVEQAIEAGNTQLAYCYVCGVQRVYVWLPRGEHCHTYAWRCCWCLRLLGTPRGE